MAGIKQIRIPLKKSEATIENIEPYLSTIYSKFNENRNKIRADHDVYCLDHDILLKTRLHDDEINNIVLSPHIRSMVDWKTGYTLGNPIKYAQSKSKQTDDITMLNKYIRNSNKRSVDSEVAKWVYSTGVGYYFLQPKSTSFNIDYEAPFDIYCQPADECTKVYSSYIGHEPLCDILYTTMDKIDNGRTKTIYLVTIYLPDSMYVYETSNGLDFTNVSVQSRGLYQYLPLVEKRYNVDGIGIVAMGRYLQAAIDKISSGAIDNIEDVVNEVWIFLNVSLGDTPEEKERNFKDMKKLGAGELQSPNPEIKPDVKTISTKLNLEDVMNARAILLRELYDTNGVPIASNNISSGNVTKSGGEVANGYDNAYNRALDDINGFIVADNHILERIIFICHNTPNCKLDELEASEIEIKYCLNMTDNMLTKSQSYVNFISNGMPPSMALEKTKISNDPEAEGEMIERYIGEHKTETSSATETKNNLGD